MFASSNEKTEECWCFAWCWCSTAEGPLLHWNHFNSLLESQCYNTRLWSSPLWCHKPISVGVTKPRVRWWLRPLTLLVFVFISSQTCGRLNNKLFFGFLEIYKDVFWLFLLLFICAVTLLYWSPACKNNPEINNKGPLNLRGSGLTLLFDKVVKSDLVTLLLWCCCQGDREALA